MDTTTPLAKPKRIGDVLIERGFINADQLSIALQQQKKAGKPLGEVLLDMGFITADEMREAVAETGGYQSIDLSSIIANATALTMIPKHVALKHTLFPVSLDIEKGELVVATAFPDDIVARDAVAVLIARATQSTGQRITPVWRITPRSDVLTAIDHFFDRELSIEGILAEMESGELDVNALTQAGISYRDRKSVV